eukprot:RCo031611
MSQGDTLMERKQRRSPAPEPTMEQPALMPDPGSPGSCEDEPAARGSPTQDVGSYFEGRLTRCPSTSQRPDSGGPVRKVPLKPWDDPEHIPTLEKRAREEEARVDRERAELLASNRGKLRESFKSARDRRLQLEANCGTVMSASCFGITTKSTSPRPPHDPDRPHLERASAEEEILQRRSEHRIMELSKLAARKAARQHLESTILPYKQSQAQSTSQKKLCKAAGSADLLDDTDNQALAELDTVFETRKKECHAARFSGRCKQPNFSLSMDHLELTRSSFYYAS